VTQADPVRVLAVGDGYLPAGVFTAALARLASGEIQDHLVDPGVLARKEVTP
jgi:hypothetical protein